jgi:hypothetical protein
MLQPGVLENCETPFNESFKLFLLSIERERVSCGAAQVRHDGNFNDL